MIPENRRLIYLVCIPLGLIAIVAIFITDQESSGVIRFGYPILFAYLLGAMSLLLIRRKMLAAVERFTFWAIAIFQFIAMGFRLFEADNPVQAWVELSPSSFMGMAILMVMAYLWYDTKAALIDSLILLIVTGAIGFPYFIQHADAYPKELFDFVRYEIYLLIVGIFVYTLARSKDRLLGSELEAARMKNLAYRDPLTGLANRRHLMELLESLHGQRRPVGVITFDLDHFKTVNDTFGHQAGDRVLIDVAAILTATTDGFEHAGRWGGEEFLVLVHGSSTDAVAMAETLRLALSEHKFESGIRLTASFGVAHSDSTESLTQLLTQADVELYRAKSAGRNTVSSTVS